MSAAENPTDPIGEFISVQQSVGLDHLSLAVNPNGFYGVQPRALLGQLAPYDPYSFPALLGCLVMLVDPVTHFMAYSKSAAGSLKVLPS